MDRDAAGFHQFDAINDLLDAPINPPDPPRGGGQSKMFSNKLQDPSLPKAGPLHLPNLPPEAEDVSPNQKIIGSYRVTKTLGQGTFGKVKEGIHLFTNQKVAIKILEKDKITEVNDIERVAREIHILKIVRHPHIIQMYEIIETPTRLYIIMEHCCNGELFSYITSKTKLKEEEACRLYQQLIGAISYLGELGIVHRDVKPENLLLDEQLNLKMVDFGLSNTYSGDEKLSTACGSPCYAAPELIKGLEYVGQKADLWSSGVVLFTLLCGHLPFEDSNTQSLYQKILNAKYKFTCYLSNEVKNLVQNILVPDPQMRYGLRQIMSNTWFKNKYTGNSTVGCGTKVGMDTEPCHANVLKEMEEDPYNVIDIAYVKKCVQANQHNALTSYYYLIQKRMRIQGNNFDDANLVEDQQLIPQGSQVKKYQSIEPVRSTLDKKVNPLQKMQPGLNDINLARVEYNVQSPVIVQHNNGNQGHPTLSFSPDLQLVEQHTSEGFHQAMTGLISPTFVGENAKQIPADPDSQMSSSVILQDKIMKGNSQGRNSNKRPFMTLQARPTNIASSTLSPHDQSSTEARAFNLREEMSNDYCAPPAQVFSPSQMMQNQFLAAQMQRASGSNHKQKQQKFKKAPPQPPYSVIGNANTKGHKMLSTINKNNVVFTESMLMQSSNLARQPVSHQEHHSLLEKEIRLAMNKSQANDSKASDSWMRKNNNSTRSFYQQQATSTGGVKRGATNSNAKKGNEQRRRGKSQMSKYSDKPQPLSAAVHQQDTPSHIRKGSAGILSPVYHGQPQQQKVYSGSKLQHFQGGKDNSYQNVIELARLMPATGGSLEQSDTDSQPNRQQAKHLDQQRKSVQHQEQFKRLNQTQSITGVTQQLYESQVQSPLNLLTHGNSAGLTIQQPQIGSPLLKQNLKKGPKLVDNFLVYQQEQILVKSTKGKKSSADNKKKSEIKDSRNGRLTQIQRAGNHPLNDILISMQQTPISNLYAAGPATTTNMTHQRASTHVRASTSLGGTQKITSPLATLQPSHYKAVRVPKSTRNNYPNQKRLISETYKAQLTRQNTRTLENQQKEHSKPPSGLHQRNMSGKKQSSQRSTNVHQTATFNNFTTTPVTPGNNFALFSPSAATADPSRLTPAISAAHTEMNSEQLKKLFRAAKKTAGAIRD